MLEASLPSLEFFVAGKREAAHHRLKHAGEMVCAPAPRNETALEHSPVAKVGLRRPGHISRSPV